MSGFRISRPTEAFQTPKRKAAKDKDYLGFIAKLPCVITRQYGVQVCHVSFANTDFGHYGRAKGSKASDRWCLPMIPERHAEQHAGSEKWFWHLHEINPHLVCVILYGLFNEAGMDALPQAEAIIMKGAFRQ